MNTSTELPPLSTIPPRATLHYRLPYSEAFLDQCRRQGDPLADRIIENLADSGDLRGYGDLLGTVREKAATEGGLYQRFLDQADRVPEWVDFDAMATGQRMLCAFPLHMGVSLFAGSLVGGAVFNKMALITGMTGMLSGDSYRRLDETAAMVMAMAQPEGLRPGGQAHELAVRVRLLHGAIRRFLVTTGKFSHPTEVPINQQDLAITLGLFGYLNIRSLGMMGIHFRQRELDSFNHQWRYLGYLMGIREELLPDSVRDQQAFFLASLKHQAHPDKLSPRTKDVMDNVARSLAKRLPGEREASVRRFLYQSCRWLSGNEYVTGMQLPDEGDYWALKALRYSGRLYRVAWRLPGGDRALGAFGRARYRRTLARLHRRRDRQGQYRVRTAD